MVYTVFRASRDTRYPGHRVFAKQATKKNPTFSSGVGQKQPGHQASGIVRSILYFFFLLLLFFEKNAGQTIKLQTPFI